MNEALLVPLLKDYITANSGAEIEETLDKLSNITGFEKELVFDGIHCEFPHIHDVVINGLVEDELIRDIPIFRLF